MEDVQENINRKNDIRIVSEVAHSWSRAKGLTEEEKRGVINKDSDSNECMVADGHIPKTQIVDKLESVRCKEKLCE
jgi:hypothetical protein